MPSPTPPPAPFVVGVPRSGTTLLRLMLDAHSQLAIPPETGVGLIAGRLLLGESTRDDMLKLLRYLPTAADLGFTEEELRALLDEVEPWSPGAGLRACFTAYAARHGKPRWGEKTPVHGQYMTKIAALLPEARFIHIIRDGRDVAVSHRGLSIDPGSVEMLALTWSQQIAEARRLGAEVPHYREVRYERLVADPERVLRELCDYVELPFEPAMLAPHERAATRHAELTDLRAHRGRPMPLGEQQRWHGATMTPTDASRAGRWRTALTEDEIQRFESMAGDTLSELGYPRTA